MPENESPLGRPIKKTCLVRGQEAQGRKAIRRTGLKHTRIIEIGPDGLMTSTSSLVKTSEVYDIQLVEASPASSPQQFEGTIGERGTTTIPSELRRRHRLRPGSHILFEERDGIIAMIPAEIRPRGTTSSATFDQPLADGTHEESDGGVLINPFRPETDGPRLPTAAERDELISRITPENVHDEFDTGGPIGREVL